MFTVIGGDRKFQKTLTSLEKEYIHNGMNWLAKIARETELKSLHLIGYTLDQIQNLPEDERIEIEERASDEWLKKNG